MMPTNVPILAVISLLLIVVAGGIINIVLLYRRKQLKYIEDKKQLNTTFENKLLETRLEIQEHTFKTISQELHDNIGQMLSLVKLNLNILEFNSLEKVKIKVNDANEILTRAIKDLRDISKTLNSDTLNRIGLHRAIEAELEVIKRASDISTSFSSDINSFTIDANAELIIFRIVQEALHNVLKHAHAKEIIVNAKTNDEALLLLIKDNGQGFDVNDGHESGAGLNNMKSRCQLINATCSIASKPGEGTEIQIQLPVKRVE